MRARLLVLVSAGLAIMLSCVETTSVEAPAEVNPNTSFTVTINIAAFDSGTETGYLAILIPEIWSVDSVYGVGYGYSGPLSNDGPTGMLSAPASGYEWSSWKTPVELYTDSGETGYANAVISTSDSLGTFQLAFCAGHYGSYHPYWEDYPCSCLVEVTPLNLEQETWGYIKVGF